MIMALVNQQARHEQTGGTSGRGHPRNGGDGNSLSDSSFSTRVTKVDFPKFNGDHVKDWLYKCDQFFSLDNTSSAAKVKLAVIHLEGKSLQWHHALMNRFGPAFDDPMSELMSLKQSSSVVEYMEQFENILTRVELIEEYKISCFITGLEYETQMHVRMFHPTTIQHAANLAKLFESAQKYKQSKYISQIKNGIPILDKPPTVYSTVEMADRRAKGLCMFYDEPFTPGHQLKHKRAQLYVVELNDDEDEDDTTEECKEEEPPVELYISMNAIIGNSHFQTMRVTGYHKKRPLQILIDSSSTHNFVDEQVVKKLGCKVETTKPMVVSVAYGNKVYTSTLCKGFSWQIQGTTFVADCMVLLLGFCDVVLGIQWLSTLGPIVWDFQQLRMEFRVDGKKHVVRGATTNKLRVVDGKRIAKSLLQGEQLALLQLCNIEEDVDAILLYNIEEQLMAKQ
uniref:Retrotransposon gag domain-containing protein n=1 Tax=Nelumbo nucifera TaxID=4432 RepID=A0A822ZIN8_NELNU|nr:TPA_asm: hypothetical protein HUJ06_001459 [Nelumbo nucifera]